MFITFHAGPRGGGSKSFVLIQCSGGGLAEPLVGQARNDSDFETGY